MSDREAAGYVAIMVGFTSESLVAVVWLSVQLIEPSLWRIAPAIVWAALLRCIVAQAIARSLAPKDLARRWVAVQRERRQEPPTGIAR